jgi:hypothetical protein
VQMVFQEVQALLLQLSAYGMRSGFRVRATRGRTVVPGRGAAEEEESREPDSVAAAPVPADVAEAAELVVRAAERACRSYALAGVLRLMLALS